MSRLRQRNRDAEEPPAERPPQSSQAEQLIGNRRLHRTAATTVCHGPLQDENTCYYSRTNRDVFVQHLLLTGRQLSRVTGSLSRMDMSSSNTGIYTATCTSAQSPRRRKTA